MRTSLNMQMHLPESAPENIVSEAPEPDTQNGSNTLVDLTTADLKPTKVRIRQSGKMKPLIDYSLKFLHENPGRPLLLHTLPYTPEQCKETNHYEPTNIAAQTISPERSSTVIHVDNSDIENENEHMDSRKSKRRKLSPVTNSINRLVSVVEVIKRQYFTKLVEGQGLHQYNFLGYMEFEKSSENIDMGESEERSQNIIAMLSGQNHLKLKMTPYMKIMLCTDTLPQNAIPTLYCYQQPPSKKMSKVAKSKLKRRMKKLERQAQNKGGVIMDSNIPKKSDVEPNGS